MTKTRFLLILGTAVLFALLGLLLMCTVTGVRGQGTTFPHATPGSQGVSAEALENLAAAVRGYVDSDKVVGAELLVVKNKHVVFHEAFGWLDRDAGVSMELNTIFNIRSMTKPLTGAAAQILIDEGRLQLADRVADYLPGFDNDKAGAITVEHLLTHTSGLPLTILAGTRDYADLVAMANAAGERGPDFPAGSRFGYSDAGSDALGAVIERVTGMPLRDFVTQRILEPLGMKDAFYPLDAGDPRWARIAALYTGGIGSWTRIWHTGDEPVYPFAWGAQSVYSTTLDYARFLAMLMDNGTTGGKRVLSREAVARILTPVSLVNSSDSEILVPTSFPGLTVYYGQMSVLYASSADIDEARPEIFGHGGSDGTWAWAWPELELMVLYFTQSRGQATGVNLERVIDEQLIHPGQRQMVAEVPEEYRPYTGTYVANFGPYHNAEFDVLVQNGHLAVDIPNLIVCELAAPDESGKWRFLLNEAVSVSFTKDSHRNVTGMMWYEAGFEFNLPKGKAPPEVKLDPDQVRKYLGFYWDEDIEKAVEVKLHNNRLSVDVPGYTVFELRPRDDRGRWYLRVNPTTYLTFVESENGEVTSFVRTTFDRESIHRRMADKESK